MNRAAKRHQKKLSRKAAKKGRAQPSRPFAQGPGGAQSNRTSELAREGVQLHQTGQVQQAEAIYRQILDIDPDHADANHLLGVLRHQLGNHSQAVDLISRAIATAPDQPMYHNNLGTVLEELGRLQDALASYRKALDIKPDYVEAHSNLGNMLQKEGQPEDAVASYRRALAIKPNYVEAHYNLGIALQELGRLEDAVASYRKALTIKPDYADAHHNLGRALRRMGQLEDAVASYQSVLAIKPGFAEAWNNLKYTTKALQFSEAQQDRSDDRYKAGLSPAARATSDFALLEYYLDGFRPHVADQSFRNAMAALPPKTDEEVTDHGADHSSASPLHLPDKLVALLHFGRAGTGLLHSLIDGHPEISTLPSIYLRGFFNAGVWEKIAASGWRGLPERFADEFEVLFDAASPKPTPGMLGEDLSHIGITEGMTTLGEGRNESLSLDRDIFCAEVIGLMKHHEKIDPRLFLLIVHEAFERTIGAKTKKHSVFYHIHNPDDFAKLNFLRYVPDARLIMMVREPIQSCESWIRAPFKENDYDCICLRIIAMLFAIDQVAFRKQDSVGIRLEDLKKRPKETLRSLCDWLGVDESPSLYETTAQGKKWWGDPSSPDYEKNKAISPFDEAPIKRALGTVFSEKDQFVLRTLFYPISVQFGYRESDPMGFKQSLRDIRPLLDDMLDFEKVIADSSKVDHAQFQSSGTYLLLRAAFLDRWDVLDEFGDYPNLLTPLDIG